MWKRRHYIKTLKRRMHDLDAGKGLCSVCCISTTGPHHVGVVKLDQFVAQTCAAIWIGVHSGTVLPVHHSTLWHNHIAYTLVTCGIRGTWATVGTQVQVFRSGVHMVLQR
jgi:hypothetical protein